MTNPAPTTAPANNNNQPGLVTVPAVTAQPVAGTTEPQPANGATAANGAAQPTETSRQRTERLLTTGEAAEAERLNPQNDWLGSIGGFFGLGRETTATICKVGAGILGAILGNSLGGMLGGFLSDLGIPLVGPLGGLLGMGGGAFGGWMIADQLLAPYIKLPGNLTRVPDVTAQPDTVQEHRVAVERAPSIGAPRTNVVDSSIYTANPDRLRAADASPHEIRRLDVVSRNFGEGSEHRRHLSDLMRQNNQTYENNILYRQTRETFEAEKMPEIRRGLASFGLSERDVALFVPRMPEEPTLGETRVVNGHRQDVVPNLIQMARAPYEAANPGKKWDDLNFTSKMNYFREHRNDISAHYRAPTEQYANTSLLGNAVQNVTELATDGAAWGRMFSWSKVSATFNATVMDSGPSAYYEKAKEAIRKGDWIAARAHLESCQVDDDFRSPRLKQQIEDYKTYVQAELDIQNIMGYREHTFDPHVGRIDTFARNTLPAYNASVTTFLDRTKVLEEHGIAILRDGTDAGRSFIELKDCRTWQQGNANVPSMILSGSKNGNNLTITHVGEVKMQDGKEVISYIQLETPVTIDVTKPAEMTRALDTLTPAGTVQQQATAVLRGTDIRILEAADKALDKKTTVKEALNGMRDEGVRQVLEVLDRLRVDDATGIEVGAIRNDIMNALAGRRTAAAAR